MTVVGLHPEELFDKEARGTLSDSERARLEVHVDQCVTCRLERQIRADFADEMNDDDGRISVSALLAFARVDKEAAARALSPLPLAAGDDVRPDPVAPPGPTLAPTVPTARLRRRWTTTWLLVAATLSAVSVAGATGLGQRAWSSLVDTLPHTVVEGTDSLVAAKAPRKQHVSRHVAPAPVVPAAPPPDVLVSPAAPPSHARVARPVVEGAAALFDQATDARRHGEYARALAIHRELRARYPASREAHVARATVGRLLLDLGDPSGALASFDEYLASGGGELGEETMVGRATALERLGRADDARRAWQALLAAYPESPYAAHAMRRLGSQSVH